MTQWWHLINIFEYQWISCLYPSPSCVLDPVALTITLLIPFCMFWSKFKTYLFLCFDISLLKFTIVCPNKKRCLSNSNPCFPLSIIQHSFWDSQFLLTRSGRRFSCHSYEKGSYSRRLPALQYFILKTNEVLIPPNAKLLHIICSTSSFLFSPMI